MGRATSKPRSWAVPSTKRVVGRRCMIRVETLTRLTKEKPQSPLSMAGTPQVTHGDRVVQAELRPEIRPHLRRHVGISGELLEGVAGGQGEDGEEDEADAQQRGDQDEEASEQVLGHRSARVRRPGTAPDPLGPS